MNKYLNIDEIVESISITHKFDKSELIFLNTSDILNGTIVNEKWVPTDELKGQAKKTIKNGDILFSEIRPKNKRFARVNVKNPDDYVVSTKLMVLRKINNNVDLDYFYYCLTNDEMLLNLQNRAENRICSFPQITFELLSEYKIRLPNLAEQQSIAAILSSLDTKIELNNKICSELESLAKNLYHYWFTQFDFPDEKGNPYRSSGGKMEWNKELRREIPEGWDVGTLANIATIIMGQSPNGNSYNVDGNGLIFFQGCTDFTFRFPTRRLYTTEPSRIAQSGDILLSVRAPVGMINIAIEKCCIGRGLSALHSNTKHDSYLLYLMKSKKEQLDVHNRNGTTFGSIDKDSLLGLAIELVPEKIKANFNRLIIPIDAQIKNACKESLELAKLRDFLLPLLMNGQVSVCG
jgi:type I restriction enzyme S subunit